MGTVADGRGAFGDLVRRHRVAAGLTQEELAERSGLSVRAIGDIERGITSRPRRSSAVLLADAMALDDPGRDELAGTARPRQDDACMTRDPVVPRQLPAAVRNFVGRAYELKTLTSLLDQADGRGGTVVISAIGGTAGVGKTALAVQWAHQVAGRFPDGQLHINLRGFDPSSPPVPPVDAIRGFLDVLGIPAARIPAQADAQAGLYRSLLSGKRMLVLLDNARDAEQVRPLLPGSPGCVAVVTSRTQLTGLVAAEGAHLLTLDVLTEPEACELLTKRLGAERLVGESTAVAELSKLCARLPLALAIASARAAMRPHLNLAALLAQHRDARDRLDALDTGEAATSARAVFSWSYQQLSDPAARMYRLLGLHPGPDVTAPAAASLTGIPVAQAELLLAELIGAHLLAEQLPGRFAFHDLLRAYAAERAATAEGDAARRAAIHRCLDHYLHSAHGADRLLYPVRDPITLAAAQAGVEPEDLSSQESALAWLQAEHKVLLASAAQASEAGFDTHAWQLPWLLADFFERQGHWRDWVAVQRIAVDAAQRLGDQAGHARARRGLAQALVPLGRYDDAHAHLQQAIDLHHELGDHVGQARAQLDRAWVFGFQARHVDALDRARQALSLLEAVGHRPGQGRALNVVGWHLSKLGHHEQALPYCCQAAQLCGELGDRLGEAAAWDSLGYVQHQLGRYAQASVCYQRAIRLTGQMKALYHQADTLSRLGDTRQAQGDFRRARQAWRQALAVLVELGHPDAAVVRAKLDTRGAQAIPPIALPSA